MSETVGFIGLGVMGDPMASNLVEAGHELVVHNRSPEPVEELVEAGAEAASSPREVAERADVVITMLPDSPGRRGRRVRRRRRAGRRVGGRSARRHEHDPPDGLRGVAEAAGERGVAALDAPVSGGDVGAQRARCRSWSAGMPRTSSARGRCSRCWARPSCTSASPGAGQVVKACNQVVVALTIAAVSEALVLGAKAGVDPEQYPRRARRRPGRQQRDGDAPEELPRARLHAGVPHRPAPQGPEHRARDRGRLRRAAADHGTRAAVPAHAARKGSRRRRPLRRSCGSSRSWPSTGSASARPPRRPRRDPCPA